MVAARAGGSGQHHHGGAVLVVVEHRDVQLPAQPLLDLEAGRRGHVLQVDAPEPGRDRLGHGDQLLRAGDVDADRVGVDVGELLEQGRLALHHRQGRGRADGPEPEHGRAVGEHGHRVPLDGQVPDPLGVGRDRLRHPPDPGGVGHRQVVGGLERQLGHHGQLAPLVGQEGAVAHLEHAHALHRPGLGRQLVGVDLVAAGDDHLPQHLAAELAHQVDVADVAAVLTDGGRHPPQGPGGVRQLQAQHQHVAGARTGPSHGRPPCPGEPG
jgi:hypothetical protein